MIELKGTLRMFPVPKLYTQRQWACSFIRVTLVFLLLGSAVHAGQLVAGVAKVDITDRDAGPVNDPLYVKALVVKDEATTLVLITVDAVAVAEIGRIGNDYLPTVQARLEQGLGIAPKNVLVNASHCHGRVCADVAERTIQAVKEASQSMTPVTVSAGSGHEDRIMENRRFRLKSGGEADSRHAYSLPPDEEIAGIGPIDPEIGVLRLDKKNGETVAAVYNFACHPIQGVPSHGDTADITGFASRVIEENLGEDTIALFLQGCAGDINPAFYKDTDHPRDAEPLGQMLGLSALRALHAATPAGETRLVVLKTTLELPRADTAERIARLEAEQTQLLQSLCGTSLNLKTFLPLVVKYGLSPEYPFNYAHRYLHEEALGRNDLTVLDAENRKNMDRYMENIHTMEALTRLQTNLNLLRKHQATNLAADKPTISVDIMGVRIGEFVLVTFPGEPSVQVGLNIKEHSPHPLTFIAGYTNGYIYYAPTEEQLQNISTAQEDCDCVLAPEWQQLYESKVAALLEFL